MLTPGEIADDAQYFEIAEAGKYLGIVKSIRDDPDPEKTLKRQLQRIYHMARRGRIPHTKVGKRLFFSRRALDEWMNKKKS